MTLPKIVRTVVLIVSENLTCVDLKNYNIPQRSWELLGRAINRGSVVSGKSIRLGYDAQHIGCRDMKFIITHSLNHMLHVDFGDKIGVPESFEIYQREMNFVKTSNKDFINSFANKHNDPNVIYRISPGDKAHSRLLLEYGFKWILDKKNAKAFQSLVVPIALHKNETTTDKEFSVIPHFGSIVCGTKLGSPLWYKPSALEAISRHFDRIVLSQGMSFFIFFAQ